MIIGGVLLPDTSPARKNAGKLHGGLSVHLRGAGMYFSVHFSGVLAIEIILFFI